MKDLFLLHNVSEPKCIFKENFVESEKYSLIKMTRSDFFFLLFFFCGYRINSVKIYLNWTYKKYLWNSCANKTDATFILKHDFLVPKYSF